MSVGAPPPAAAPWTPPPRYLAHHPRATLAMALGIVSVAGVVTVVLAPLAWYFGVSSMREIDREPGRWGGRGVAKAGLILGIIGTGLLVLALMVTTLILLGLLVVHHLDTGYGN